MVATAVSVVFFTYLLPAAPAVGLPNPGLRGGLSGLLNSEPYLGPVIGTAAVGAPGAVLRGR